MSITRCLYPGSFDPVTNGHMDIIRRAARLFDQVVVGVLHNPDKHCCFSIEQRVALLKKACAGLDNVEVIASSALLARLTQELDIPVVVRGVRSAADLESETMMSRINHQLNPALETLLFPASDQTAIVSASLVRQLASFGADISPYVPPEVLKDILSAIPAPGRS